MATTLSEAATYLSTVTVPSNGDPRTVSSVNVAFSALANRTKYLRDRLQALDSDEDGEVDAPLRPPAGTTTVAPLKLTAGTNLTTPENGAVEYDGTDLTLTTGGNRRVVAYEDQLHAQETDTGTTSPTFELGINLHMRTVLEVYSSAVQTESTSWEDLASIPLVRYHSCAFSLMALVHDHAMENNYVGAFKLEGIIKRNHLASEIAFVENSPTVTRLGSDAYLGTYHEIRTVADTTNGALLIQGKAITSNATGWSLMGHIMITATDGAYE